LTQPKEEKINKTRRTNETNKQIEVASISTGHEIEEHLTIIRIDSAKFLVSRS